MDLANKLEMHYYFGDRSHSMDANIRNKCEAELLAIAYEAIDILGYAIRIEAQAATEGGLRDIWKFIGKNSNQLAFVISVLSLIVAMTSDPDEVDIDLRTKLVKLSIEEKELEIQKLRKELEGKELSARKANETAKIINGHPKVIMRRSNFYNSLSQVEKITQLGVSGLNEQGIQIGPERLVGRDDFKKYILLSHGLDPVVIEEAWIEIVAPVLNEGRAKWRGVFEGEQISFTMADKDFRNSVLNKMVSFKRGTTLVCQLTIYAKLDEFGDKVITGYKVSTVLSHIDGSQTIETLQGKKLRRARQSIKDQHDLFSDR